MAAANQNKTKLVRNALAIVYAFDDEIDKVVATMQVDDEKMEEGFMLAVRAYSLQNERVDAVRSKDFFEWTVQKFSEQEFRKHLRISRASFDNLFQLIGRNPVFEQKNKGGRKMVDVKKQICIFIWFLSSKDPLRIVSLLFDVCEASVYRIIRRASQALKDVVSDLIKWPDVAEQNTLMNGFKSFNGMKGVIGAIDGSHIGIKAPHFCSENYIKRKGYHSIVLQGVCNDKMLFTDVYVGWPGSVHDARVFTNSDLHSKIEMDPPAMFAKDYFLVGDAAYPLSRHLLTPFKNNGFQTNEQKRYNFVQSSTRNVIERCFALLKGKFPRLHHIEVNRIEDAVMITLAACVMHNFARREDEEQGIDDTDQFLIHDQQEDINSYVFAGASRQDAEDKRLAVMRSL